MDTRSKNNIISVIYMYYAKNSDLSLESSYIFHKGNPKLQYTPRTDLIDDSDMQIIEITIDEVRKVQIFNIYNEKSQSDRET